MSSLFFVFKKMKKISIITLLCSTLFLAWCGKSGQDMSFQDAYWVLKSHNIFANKQYDTPDTTKALHDETTIDFSLHANQWFVATGTLRSSWDYNLPDQKWWVNMYLMVDSEAYEPSFWSNVALTWVIQFVENSWKIYGRINWFSLTPEKEAGNVEWGVINALINTISKKWITLSEWWEKTALVPYRKNIIEFFHQFNLWRNKHSLFKEIGKTKIDWYTAYKIWWDEEWVKSFVQYILQDAKNIWTPIAFDWSTMDEAIQWIISSPIEWYIIIKASNHVILRIDSISTKDSGILWFVYSKDWLLLTLKDTDNTIVATWDVTLKDKELVFNLSVPSNNIFIAWFTQNNQSTASITFKNTEFVLNTTIWGITNAIENFLPSVVTWSIPLAQILEWFSILQWNDEWDNITK